MKKTTVLFSMLFVAITSFSQSIADAVKLVQYGKLKSAKDMLQKMYAANNKDAQAIYWLGQTMIANENVNEAKTLYQSALQSGVSDGLLFIGMAHVDLLNGGEWSAANQKFESAITTSTETKGKNKGKAPVYIYNAIGRANVIGRLVKDGTSKFGNMDYSIEKLKIAKDVDVTNTECFIYMGLSYRKMGGEFGGEALKAYTQALNRNPNMAQANHMIGKIYQSQQNKEAMETYFEECKKNDPTYAPVYLDYYLFNANRDVTKAKENIEKYIQYGDKDCKNDYFYADYLFQAGKYSESLAKAKELENTECNNRVAVLYAYNYDRMNDSIQAKTSIEKFLNNTTPDKILSSDYEIAARILSRFPGSEAKAIEYISKLADAETDSKQKLRYATIISDLASKSGNVDLQIQSIEKLGVIRGNVSESDYYKMYNAYFTSKSYDKAIDVCKKYITAYPASNYGYDYYIRVAKKVDTGNNTGLLFDASSLQAGFMMKDTAKYKQKLINNYYDQMAYYNDAKKDYTKAIEMCDEILKLVPNEAQTLKIRESIKKNADRKSAAPPAKPTPPAKPATPAAPKDKKKVK